MGLRYQLLFVLGLVECVLLKQITILMGGNSWSTGCTWNLLPSHLLTFDKVRFYR